MHFHCHSPRDTSTRVCSRARCAKIALMIVVAIAVFGAIVMALWNWLMPPIFGLHPIGFAQAVGLLVLARILFGGRGRRHFRRNCASSSAAGGSPADV